jgi:hypothetical protein
VLIAITGSREGLTDWQRAALTKALRRPTVTGIVHGDCVGADAEADAVAASLGLPRWCYPSNAWLYRANTHATKLADPAPPLVRNEWIVRDGAAVVALPRPSSRGTWHAVRIAQRLGKALLVLGEAGVIPATGWR